MDKGKSLGLYLCVLALSAFLVLGPDGRALAEPDLGTPALQRVNNAVVLSM